jgi:hypothetical protein
MNTITPETRSMNDKTLYWIRKYKDGTIEYYNKEIFNSDLTRKEDFNFDYNKIEEVILKDILLNDIETILNS